MPHMDANTLQHTISMKPEHDAPVTKIRFSGNDAFLREVKRRAELYFVESGRSPRDCPQMYFKSATIFSTFVITYMVLLFFVHSWWLIVPLAMLLGLAMSAIGFNIQHDGGHKAYSDKPWINKIMAMSLDLIGGSSYLWNWKHNSIHHTYPNIHGHDDDIELGWLGRLSPHQKHHWFHRVQCVYLWLLYGFLGVKWHLWDDFYNLWTSRIGGHHIPRPRGKDLMVFIGGKIAFFSLAFGIPMLLHPVGAVIAVYAIAAFTSGVVLSIVFQLAHCVEEANFPVPSASGVMDTDWAVHQVQTTVNFAPRNPVISWLVGGLNFQIEHHLFRKICHIHYPALSKVVEDVCKDFGLRYSANRTFFVALASHFRWLRRMGQPG